MCAFFYINDTLSASLATGLHTSKGMRHYTHNKASPKKTGNPSRELGYLDTRQGQLDKLTLTDRLLASDTQKFLRCNKPHEEGLVIRFQENRAAIKGDMPEEKTIFQCYSY